MSSTISINYLNKVNGFRSSQASFGERIAALKQERQIALRRGGQLSSIAIFGGGPAGLTRAIDALISGNPVSVFEKRKDDGKGRENVVHLKMDSMPLLRYYGVYQYLFENNYIFAADQEGFSVRIKDLECAMKAVMSELSPDPVIKYDSYLERITNHPHGRADLVLMSEGRQIHLNSVDVVVVVEGKNSSTNENLFHNRRISVLPSLPVIAAIFKDTRPKVTGIQTLCEYAGQTMSNTAVSVYYYTLFFFKCIFQGEHIFNPDRRIAGSLILQTPNQHYVGCGLSKEETKEMDRLSQKLAHAKSELAAARRRNGLSEEIVVLDKKVSDAQVEWEGYIHYWAAMGFCFANILNIFLFITRQSDLRKGVSGIASWQPLHHFFIAEIGADKSNSFSGRIGETSYLIAGDTLATVDPTTGLGCNTAIQTTVDFHHYISGMNSRENIGTLQLAYNARCEEVISNIHTQSRIFRRAYRPDALVP